MCFCNRTAGLFLSPHHLGSYTSTGGTFSHSKVSSLKGPHRRFESQTGSITKNPVRGPRFRLFRILFYRKGKHQCSLVRMPIRVSASHLTKGSSRTRLNYNTTVCPSRCEIPVILLSGSPQRVRAVAIPGCPVSVLHMF